MRSERKLRLPFIKHVILYKRYCILGGTQNIVAAKFPTPPNKQEIQVNNNKDKLVAKMGHHTLPIHVLR